MSEAPGKNIVLCSDGTGNSPDKGRGTNVWRMYLAVDQNDHLDDPSEAQQLAFYDNGIGTTSIRLRQAISGAFGIGLGQNIRELYADLAKNYEPGDRAFLFGFSRGAYTVRSLAGMIHHIGIVDGSALSTDELRRVVRAAYWAYRSRLGRARRRFDELLAAGEIALRPGSVHFVGVWDTVGAIGLPFDWPRAVVQRAALLRRPHAIGPNASTRHVCHALAIDDDRRSFKPDLYSESEQPAAADADAEPPTLEQVWFAGSHSNVGGGYPKQGLENIALDWMMTRAEARGLRFIQQAAAAARDGVNAHCQLYDSRAGLAAYFRYRPRDLVAYCKQSGAEPKVHVSVMERIARQTDGYTPVNLPPDFELVGTRSDTAYLQGHVAHYKALVTASTAARRENRKRIRKLCVSREVLYFVFLFVTLFLVGLMGIFELDRVTEGHPTRLARMADTAVAVVSGLSDGLKPVLGWIRSIPVEIASSLHFGVKVALPEMLSGPTLALFRIPELMLVFVLLGWALFAVRKNLLKAIKKQGTTLWQDCLRAPRAAEKP